MNSDERIRVELSYMEDRLITVQNRMRLITSAAADLRSDIRCGDMSTNRAAVIGNVLKEMGKSIPDIIQHAEIIEQEMKKASDAGQIRMQLRGRKL